MDPGPRDRRPRREIQRTSCLHVTCKREIVWEHSPTRRKYWDTLRLNRRAPPCYQGPTIPVGPPPANPYMPRGAPHGRPRGLLSRVSATCASRGPPGLYHVALVPCRTSRRFRVPRQRPLATSAPAGKNPFSRF